MSSTTIDSKVVELEFQNSQFETNASRSLSTLEKLKRALNLSDAPKGFDEINSSVQRVNVNGLTKGIQGLSGQFSALEIIAKRALENLTDSAYRMTSQFVKSVTIDQVSAGWDKYAEKTSAVQTIMAATAKDFSDTETQMAYVNAQLEKLNWFTDETSYNFLDMVNNIGKFTSNNIPLDQAVTSMEGISTWAAISGANVNEAGRAMYNLSQAIATGAVKLMDWKSIENANMATAGFKQTAIETAEALGTLTKTSDDTWKTLKGHEVSVQNFNQNLSDSWFTSEVLLKSLDKYGKFTDELYGFMSKVDESVTTSTVLDYLNDFTEGTIDWQAASRDLGMSAGDLKTELTGLSDEALALGKDAFKAAQEAKTFQEAVDSVKDAVSTGWMNTYEILFGDYTHAKVLWTDLANELYDIFAEGGNVRNELLSEAFETSSAISSEEWAKLEEAGIVNPEFVKRLRQSVAEHGVAVRHMGSDEEWLMTVLERGALTFDDIRTAYEAIFGSNTVDEGLKSQVESLQETDESVASLFETLGKYSGEDIEKIIFGDGSYTAGYEELERTLDKLISKLGLGQEAGSALVDVLKSMGFFGGETANKYHDMSDAQLRSLGLTQADIEEIHREKEALEERNKVLDEMSQSHMTGGEMWTQSLYNSVGIITGLISAVKDAWADVFPEMSSDTIFNFTKDLYELTTAVRNFVENNEQFHTILTGILSAFDIGYRVVRALANAGFKVLTSTLEGFGTSVLDIGEKTANLIGQFREWLISNQILEKSVAVIESAAKSAGSVVRGWVDSFANLPIVQKNLTRFKYAFKATLKQLPAYMEGAKERVDGFIAKVDEMGGIKLDNIGDVFKLFKEDILDYFLEFPGFKRFSAAFSLLGSDIKDALKDIGIDLGDFDINLGDFFSGVIDVAKFVGEQIGSLFNSIISTPSVSSALEKLKAGFKSAFESLPEFFAGAGERITAFMERVRALGGINLDNIGDVFADFKENVLGYFTDFEGFQGLKDAFSGIFDDIKASLLEKGINLDGILGSVTDLINSIKAAFDGVEFPGALKDFFSLFKKDDENVTENIETTTTQVKSFSDAVCDVIAALQDFFTNVDAKPLVTIISSFLGLLSLKTISGMFDKVTNVIRDIYGVNKELLEAKTNEINARRLMEFAAAIVLLAVAVRLLAGIPILDLAKAGGAILVLGIALVVFAKALNKLPNLKNLKNLSSGIFGFAAAILVLVAALKLMEYLDPEKLEGNIVTLVKLIGILLGAAFLMSAISNVGSSAGTGTALLGISASIILLIGIFKILELVDFDTLLAQLPKFGLLLAMLAAVMLSTKLLGQHVKGAAGTIVAIGGAFLMLSVAMHILAGLDSGDLNKAIKAMTTVGIVLAMVLAAANHMQSATGTVIALAALITILTGCIAGLSFIPEESLTNVTNSLSKVLGMLALLGTGSGIAGKLSGGTSSPAWATVLALIGLVADIGLVVGGLADLESKTGTVLPVMDKLNEIFTSLSETLAIITIGGIFGVGAAGALLKLAGVILGLGVVLAILGGVSRLWPEAQGAAEDLLNDGMPFLEMMVEAIGRLIGVFIGALVGGAVETFTESLPMIMVNLTSFIGELIPFCEKVNELPETDFSNLSQLTNAIVGIAWDGLITAFLNSAVKSQRGMDAAEAFTKDVKNLAEAITAWTEAMDGVDPADVPTTVISDLATSISTIGWSSLIGVFVEKKAEWDKKDGTGVMTAFKENVKSLAEGIKSWSEIMEGVDPEDVPSEQIDKLAEAIKKINIASISGAIYDLVESWAGSDGEKDGTAAVDAFSENLSTLANALIQWKIKATIAGKISVPTEAINGLVDSIKSIPGEGGLFDAIDEFLNGTPDLESFKTDAGNLAEALNEYVSVLNTDTDLSKVGLLTEVVNSISNIIGAMTLYNFGIFEQVKEGITKNLGPALQEFATMEIDTENLHSLSSSANLIATAATKFKDVKINGTDMLNTTSVNTFITNVESVADMISGLADINTSGVDKFVKSVGKIASSSIESAKSILENKLANSTSKESSAMNASGADLGSSLVSGFSGKSSDVSSASQDLVSSALSTITGNKEQFSTEGNNLMSSFANGLLLGAASVNEACRSIVSSLTGILRGYHDSWYGAGRYLSEGFGMGISSYIFEAAARAASLARAALGSAKAVLQEQSPSKATYEMGMFFGMGFTNALTDYMSTAEKSGYTFGKAAKDGLNQAIEESNNLIMSSDISNNPRITPVLDLSEIQSGVGTLGNMLALDAPIGVTGNLTAIGSNLNGRNTATSGDILSALHALGTTLGNKPSGDTYNINGVTYDDGSNITEAVRSLIRAARVERRA